MLASAARLRPLRRARRAPATADAVRWPLLAVVAPVVLVVRQRRRLSLPRAISSALAVSAPLIVAAALPRRAARHVLLWSAQMWAYKVAFEIPYDRPARVRTRLHVDGPLRIDEALGGGVAPSQRLQERFRRPGEVNWPDRMLAAVYLFWEAEPHLALGAVLLKRPGRFAAAAARQAATFDLTLLGYWLMPSAPPWWASEQMGRMDGRVQRVVPRVIRDARDEPLEQDDNAGANPWAAMPSDHFASALAAALTLRELHPAAGAAGLGYAGLLGFALVYLGEHYVADLLAGAALAAAVAALERPLAPIARRIDAAWRRLEPG